MATPAKHTAAAPEPTADEILERAKARKAKPGLTPQEIRDLTQTYKDVALAKDDDGKAIKRAIEAKMRRLTHEELHPQCTKKVTMNVPWHPTSDTAKGIYVPFSINGKPYQGHVALWPCEARQLASLVEVARGVEQRRFADRGATIDLDNPVAERIRQIQEA